MACREWLSFLRIHRIHGGRFCRAVMGGCGVRADDGRRHGRRRLAHHQNAGSQDGEAASDQWIRRRRQFRAGDSCSIGIRTAGVDHACGVLIDHGRWRSQTFQRHSLVGGRAHGVGVDSDAAGDRTACLRVRFYCAAWL